MATQGQQVQDPEIPKKWPLIVLPENRQEDTTKDTRLVNGYMEKDLRGDYTLFKRPGFARFGAQPSGGAATGRGVYNWLGDIYTVAGSTLYKAAVSKGTVDATGGVYHFDRCMGATPKLSLGNGVKFYNYDDAGGLVVVTGTDLDFPTTFVKGPVYLDQTTYVMDLLGNIQGSDLDDPVNWAAGNLTIAYIEADAGVALAKQLVYVVALKAGSTEIFYNAGTSPAPLGRVQGAKVNYGCASANSVQDLDGVLFWLSTTRSAGAQVLKLENLKAEIVSTPAIERLLGEADFTTIYSWTLKYEGHRWYVVTFKEENLTLAFDASTGLWAQWTDAGGNYVPIVSSTFTTVLGNTKTLLQHESDGYLYTMEADNLSDVDGPITVDIYTPNFDAGVDRTKHLPRLYFDADQVTGSTLQVRCSDDDYKTWSNFRYVDLGRTRPILDKCGSFYRRAYNFRHQSNTRFRIKAVGMQLGVGTL